jgi:acyl-CoA thioesterase
MNQLPMPNDIVNQMMQQDLFSQWLGIDILDAGAGYCRLKMLVRQEMCNGFGIAHGGIAYALADSALAFASNAHGRKAVSIETSISHIKSIMVGDLLMATAVEKHISGRLAIYEVRITKHDETLAALFKGTVFRKDEEWPQPPPNHLKTI